MKLIAIAHRAEAQAFLKSRHLALKPEAFAFDGLYYSTEHNLALLLTGEGVQSATEKLAALCGAKHNKIQEIINLGVAGILENSPQFELGGVKEIRTAYHDLGHKMEFKSFSTSSQTSPFHLCDIVTSSKRALKKKDCEELLPFAPLVDRETWAIGSVANRFQIPFRSLKVLSDKVYEADQGGSLEVCRLIKDQAPLWSQQLLAAFDKIVPLEKEAHSNNPENKKELLKDNTLLDFIEKSTTFHVTTSQKRKVKSLWDILLSQSMNEKALMTELKDSTLTPLASEKGTPKSKTSKLIERLENLISPFKTDFHKLLEKETKALNEARCKIVFSNQFETDSIDLNFTIRKPKDVFKLQKAIEKTDFTTIQNLLNGQWDSKEMSPSCDDKA
ncbi:MAG: hypothetical protein CME68_07990 [Halobacteriovoraceae bacterium]|nr:hypothetical protein [Halobacteriovoraceae bacterium]